MNKKITLVYSPEYNIRFGGLEKLHPFDSCKYERAWNLLEERFGESLKERHLTPSQEISDEDLLRVHSQEYLDSLRSSAVAAQALEMPMLAPLPSALIQKHIFRPMRLATQGTVLASEQAMQGGFAVNLSGGYHHASGSRGEGFCLFSDVSVAIAKLRQSGALRPGKDRILYIDLDAHQGNGIERVFLHDRDVFILDAYNRDIYPNDRVARERIDCALPLDSGTGDSAYLAAVRKT